MSDVVNALREHLIAEAIVRAPNVAGAGARPWLPPAYRHPDDGPVGPGDADDQGKAVATDDGLVVSIMWAPGIPPGAGEEERRIYGVDVVYRSDAMPPLVALENTINLALIGTDPGGQCDWVMGGLYVIQCRQWRPFQPINTEPDVFTFSTGYTVEVRAA